MKKTFRLYLVALTIALSAGACKGHKSAGAKDSLSSQDSMSTQDTTRHTDTVIKADTVKPATDTSDAKVDTVSKKITNHTVIKKTAVEKAKHK